MKKRVNAPILINGGNRLHRIIHNICGLRSKTPCPILLMGTTHHTDFDTLHGAWWCRHRSMCGMLSCRLHSLDIFLAFQASPRCITRTLVGRTRPGPLFSSGWRDILSLLLLRSSLGISPRSRPIHEDTATGFDSSIRSSYVLGRFPACGILD